MSKFWVKFNEFINNKEEYFNNIRLNKPQKFWNAIAEQIKNTIDYYLYNYKDINTEFYDFDGLVNEFEELCVEALDIYIKSRVKMKKVIDDSLSIYMTPDEIINEIIKNGYTSKRRTFISKYKIIEETEKCERKRFELEKKYSKYFQKEDELFIDLLEAKKNNKSTRKIEKEIQECYDKINEYKREKNIMENRFIEKYKISP